jgi:hypothetical protein
MLDAAAQMPVAPPSGDRAYWAESKPVWAAGAPILPVSATALYLPADAARAVYNAWVGSGVGEVLALPPIRVAGLHLAQDLFRVVVENASVGSSCLFKPDAASTDENVRLHREWKGLARMAEDSIQDPGAYLGFQAKWLLWMNEVVAYLEERKAWPTTDRGMLALFLLDIPRGREAAVLRAVVRCQHPRLCFVLGFASKRSGADGAWL